MTNIEIKDYIYLVGEKWRWRVLEDTHCIALWWSGPKLLSVNQSSINNCKSDFSRLSSIWNGARL